MEDIVKELRIKAKHKTHTEPIEDCSLCASPEVEEDVLEDFEGSLDDAEPAVEPDKKAARLTRIMGNR